jgi:hypothetical protein
VIENLGNSGHLPAALWMAEGLQTGEIGRVSLEEAVEVLRPLVLGGSWAIEVEEALEADNAFDRMQVLRMAAALGNSDAEAMLSYPALFE